MWRLRTLSNITGTRETLAARLFVGLIGLLALILWAAIASAQSGVGAAQSATPPIPATSN